MQINGATIEAPRDEITPQSVSTPICVIHKSVTSVSETFIRAHSKLLPADVTVVHFPGVATPYVGDAPVLSQSFARRGLRALGSQLRGTPIGEGEVTRGYVKAFRQRRAQAVLAEYGPVGVEALNACRILDIPLIVHFHGYDASVTSVLEEYRDRYRQLFHYASGVVAVSRAMEERLLSLGASRSQLFYNPYGVECERFIGAAPATSRPVFLSVGRFVEKKAPFLTICAFARVCREHPSAQLRMIGDGPLLGPCRDLVVALELEKNVSLLGSQGHLVVADEMKQARAFVQHSVQAENGDCEGTPVAILEASAAGLPIIATRHAGIPDVVVHEGTGLLMNERDVGGMANAMQRLFVDPDLAGRLGRAGQSRARQEFSMERSIGGLWKIISSAIQGKGGRQGPD